MYVYVRTSGVARVRVCAFVHVCMYVRKYDVRTYVRIRICVLGFACVGPAMRATRAYIHTYDVATHCATMARRHRYSGVMSPHVRTYAHMAYVSCMRWASHESYAGLHTHKRCCCTLWYCSKTPSLLCTLQADSSARGTPCVS